jgi:PEGA domain
MRTTSRLVALAAALALAAPSLPAFAQGAQSPPSKEHQLEAGTRFKKGLELFKDGDFQAAQIEFRRAFELAPNFNVLYNIGQVSFQLQDYPGALDAFQRYLSEGGDRVPAARKADVLKDIEKLKSRVATVEIVSTVPDAEISIDDVSMGKTPLAKPILVSAGRHKISVSKAGFTASTKVIEIASGDSLKLPLDPAAQGTAPAPVIVEVPRPLDQANAPPVVAPPPAPPPDKPVRAAPIVFGVATGVLTVGAVVTGILALGASSDLATQRQSSTATRASLDSAHDKTTTLALTTDILSGCAVVALGVTLFTGLRKDSAPAPATSGSLVQVRVGFGGNAVRVLGSF